MWFARPWDPGPCPVDDAPHTTCCAPGSPPVVVELLPATAANRAAARAAGLQAAAVQATLPAGSFTTATYPRRKRA